MSQIIIIGCGSSLTRAIAEKLAEVLVGPAIAARELVPLEAPNFDDFLRLYRDIDFKELMPFAYVEYLLPKIQSSRAKVQDWHALRVCVS